MPTVVRPGVVSQKVKDPEKAAELRGQLQRLDQQLAADSGGAAQGAARRRHQGCGQLLMPS